MATPDRILDAAAAEFAERGFDGVRIEHVAKRAGLNKALVYRHFDDKAGLYRATLGRELGKRTQVLDELPADLGERLVFWSRRQAHDKEFIRLVAREGLGDDGSEPVEAEARAAYYARQVDSLRALQAEGELRDDLDPECMFFALLALTVAPVLLPQIMRLSIPDDDRDDRWESFLAAFAERL